jgi:hypothetical protein
MKLSVAVVLDFSHFPFDRGRRVRQSWYEHWDRARNFCLPYNVSLNDALFRPYPSHDVD